MEDKYEGMDEATLKQMLDQATSYEDRSELRKAIRKLKSGGDAKKKAVGSANYRRAGYQAQIKLAIPNSVTGNVLPNKVSTENMCKVEVPQSKATISYLKSRSGGSSAASTKKPADKRASPGGSVSSEPGINGRKDSVELADDFEGSSTTGSVTEREIPSPQPPASRTRVEGVTSPDSLPATPSPTPPPPKEPTPPPPREPTPPPPREPTPPPPKEPTPPPPKEPTPPPREPTPPPPKEPTPSPEPSPEPEPEPQDEEVDLGEEEEVEEEIEVEVEEEEEESDEEQPTEGVRVNYDSDEEEESGGRVFSPSSARNRQSERNRAATTAAPAKPIVPLDVLTKKEEGVEGGDFRKRLQKTEATKIDTTSAFPQARPKGEQVDFRNVLKKSEVKEAKVNTFAAFPQARQKGEQVDFRNILKKVDGKTEKKEPPPAPQKKKRQSEEETRRAQRSPTPEPAEDAGNVEEEQEDLSESLGSGAAALEGEEEEEMQVSLDDSQTTNTEEVKQSREDVDGEADTPSPSYQSRSEADGDSYEARQAERRRKREQRRKELASMMADTKPDTAVTSPPPATNGTEEDSYEARKEARRKAREERLKAASARVGGAGEDRPKMSYKERKTLEARKNAKDSRKQWENREEDSGSKSEARPASFKKKDSATQQLLAWCQHKTKYYENVEIKDFRSSWSSGLAFCAIMHSFLPDKIPYDELTPEDRRRNFTLAFDVAKEAGIPEMLDVDDMVAIKIPDAKSIMTFLVTIYQHFNS